MKRFLLIVLAVVSIAFNQPVLAQKHTKTHTSKYVKKDVVVYITRTGAKYHREYCSYLRRSSIPIKLKEALSEGYTPCSRCNP